MGLHVPNFWAFCCIVNLHVITLVLLMNLFHPTSLVKALGNETDRFALLKFKEAIATDPHGFLNSWNDSFPICNWHGITCGRRHQRVTALKLPSYDLHGTISPYIGNLSFLTFINLDNNSFSGKIPQQVDHLFRLHHLSLSYNLLEGRIPVNLTFCPELSIIDFVSNRLSGEIPSEIGSLKKLVYLNLYSNNLTGGIPPSLGNLSFITTLSLEYNNLVGNVPEEIGRLQSFSTFYIGSNNLSGSFGSVYKGILEQEKNSVVAIKVLNLQQKGASKSFMAECNALRNIRHKNLVKILTCCSSMDHNGNDFKALVFEYMSNGSLEEWLHSEDRSRSLSLAQRLNIVVDVASALCYLHDHLNIVVDVASALCYLHDHCEQPIIHRDLKPSNVLLDNDMCAHVGDFGLAKLISITTDSSQDHTSTVGIKGTIGYTAPEYASGVEASKRGDVYSYGILVLQMFTGRRPTDEIFKDGLNLHNFAKMAIPGKIVQIVDPTLLATLEETTPATIGNEVNYINEIEAEEENENQSKMNSYMWKCILPILKIGLACSEESPNNRMCMEDVAGNLHRIQNVFNGVGIRREIPPRS